MPLMQPGRRRSWRMSLRTSSVLPPTRSRRRVQRPPEARSAPAGSRARGSANSSPMQSANSSLTISGCERHLLVGVRQLTGLKARDGRDQGSWVLEAFEPEVVSPTRRDAAGGRPARAATFVDMSESSAISAAIRQVAAGLVSAAEALGGVLESVADALQTDEPEVPAPDMPAPDMTPPPAPVPDAPATRRSPRKTATSPKAATRKAATTRATSRKAPTTRKGAATRKAAPRKAATRKAATTRRPRAKSASRGRRSST